MSRAGGRGGEKSVCLGGLSGEAQAMVGEQRHGRVSGAQRWENLSRLPAISASACDGYRAPTLLVLTRLAQCSGRLAAESVPGKVKAKNIPERGERRGPRTCGLYAAPALPGSGNHRAFCWSPLLEMTEFPDY